MPKAGFIIEKGFCIIVHILKIIFSKDYSYRLILSEKAASRIANMKARAIRAVLP